MKISNAIINEIKDCIHSIAPEASTYLYGSQARGDYSAHLNGIIVVSEDNCI